MDENVFREMLASVREAGAILKGKKKPSRRITLEQPSTKEIRLNTRLTQIEFAELIGVPVKTLQNWEQERTKPSGPAKALLRALAKDPKTTVRLLAA